MRRGLVGLTVGLVVSAALWPGGVSAATGALDRPSGYTVTGWSGERPVSVGLAVSASGAGTVAFTTSDASDGARLWVADRPAYGLWGKPETLGSDVVAGTASFAEARSGAAVAAWDERGSGGSRVLRVSYRTGAGLSWTAPSTLATDQEGAHLARVGISSAGIVTVAYAHRTDRGASLVTEQHGPTGWARPVEHATRVPKQVRLNVDDSGDATLAWTEHDPTHVIGQLLTLRVSRFDEATRTWETPVLLDERVVATGLLAVDANAAGRGAVVYVAKLISPSVLVAHYFSPPGCGGTCASRWVTNGLGAAVARQSASVSLTETGGDGAVAALDTRLPDGTNVVAVFRTNGTEIELPTRVLVPAAAKVSDVRLATGGGLAVTWTQTTASGSALVVLPLRLTYLGVVAAGLPTLLGEVVPGEVATNESGAIGAAWTDPSDTSPTLRTWLPSVSGTFEPAHPFTTGTRIQARWQPAAAPGGATYDLQAVRATPTSEFGRPRTLLAGTTATSAVVAAKPGQTVCLSTRAHGPDGYTTPWSVPRCSTVALDDTALTAGRGWTRQKGSTLYGGSRLTSTTQGARLTLRGTSGVGVALLVTRRPGGGRVDLTSRNRIEAVSTAGTRADQVVVGERLYGGNVISPSLRLTVHGRNRPVSIDGVFITKALTP